MQLKRYLAFFGPFESIVGGMNNFVGDFDTIESAKRKIYRSRKKHEDTWQSSWGHVYDIKTNEYAWESPNK